MEGDGSVVEGGLVHFPDGEEMLLIGVKLADFNPGRLHELINNYDAYLMISDL